MYCQIDEFLVSKFLVSFWFSKCSKYCHEPEAKQMCNWCHFYEDMFTFSHEFYNLTSKSKIFKLINIFNLFIKIINCWLSVNSKVVNDFFDLLPTRSHSCI